MIKKLYNAITNLPDDIVDEAGDPDQVLRIDKSVRRKKRIRIYTSLLAAGAACAVIAAGVFYPQKSGEGNTSSNNALGADGMAAPGYDQGLLLLNVNYPAAYSFNDNVEIRERRAQNPVSDEFYTSLSDFSYRTAGVLLAENENSCISPVSLYYALAAAAEGAEGTTQAEMLELLGVADKDELAVQCHNLYNVLFCDNEVGSLIIKNRIRFAQGLDVREEYIERLADSFYAESYSGGNELLSIINTIDFNDEWEVQFDEKATAAGTFYLSDGGTAEGDFMNAVVDGIFRRGDGYTGAELGLRNGGKMVFVLPDEGQDIHRLAGTAEGVAGLLNGGESFVGEVVWKLPKFSYSAETELKTALNRLGLNECFMPGADFSGIVQYDDANDGIFIDRVMQKTSISLNENGVSASAYTKIDFDTGGVIVDGRAEMILDRPFLYAAINADGVVIFMGICDNPELMQ